MNHPKDFTKIDTLKQSLPRSAHALVDGYQKSRSKAVKLHCIVCMGACEGYRKEIQDCTAPACALYPWRPFQTKKR
jgi:hypothetical protein